MHLLVPWDPLDHRRPDEHFAEEAAAAAALGLTVVRIDHDLVVRGDAASAVAHLPDVAAEAVYRGWMMRAEEYSAFEQALATKGIRLRTTAAMYRRAHELPGWYAALADSTPPSVWTEGPAEADFRRCCATLGAGAAVLRDYTKSMKHYWETAAFIPDVADGDAAFRVASRFLELRDEMFTGGFVLRRFEELGADEVRTWWVDGACVLVAPHPDARSTGPAPAIDLAWLDRPIRGLALPFVTVDLALRKDGIWRVVELGDGQVSDRPRSVSAEAFVRAVIARAARGPFDPEAFRSQAHAVVDRLADHLVACEARAVPVLPWAPPRESVAAWANDFAGGQDPVGLFERVIAGATHLHHPGFVGHQVTSPFPLGAVATMVSGLLNNGAAVYEMGPVGTAMERVLAAWLAKKIGYPESADGVFTSGGSLGNLTALLAARAHAGLAPGERGVVLACEEAHYCTARAVRIMGWGEEGLVKVPADENFRMRTAALEEAAAGKRVVAVVASACSTSTGAFDPLPEIADFCERRGIWLHVDGAHGASFALSPRHRGLVRGIERADSIVWDAHKMLLCPALVTAVLFKRGADSFAAFHGTEAAYLLNEEEQVDSALRVVECTKQMLVLPLYAALAVHGEKVIADYLDGIVDLARNFAARLRAEPDFELAVEPECNIVCFRHEGDDAHQERIRARLLEEGAFYVVKTRLRGRTWLRTTLINPRTTREDLARLVTAIRALA